jgi:hypothetical protein
VSRQASTASHEEDENERDDAERDADHPSARMAAHEIEHARYLNQRLEEGNIAGRMAAGVYEARERRTSRGARELFSVS